MKHEYDWSKLDRGWEYSDTHHALLFAGSMILVNNAEAFSGGTDSDHARFATMAKAQLAKCRIAKPVAQQYDWSRLEGSGWEFIEFGWEFIESNQCISKPTMGFIWRYWPDTGLFSAHITNPSMQPNSEAAKAAYLEAYDLVQKCRVDWRDEVREACEGVVSETDLTDWLIVRTDRTMNLRPVIPRRIETILALSVVIERLKKRGWREA